MAYTGPQFILSLTVNQFTRQLEATKYTDLKSSISVRTYTATNLNATDQVHLANITPDFWEPWCGFQFYMAHDPNYEVILTSAYYRDGDVSRPRILVSTDYGESFQILDDTTINSHIDANPLSSTIYLASDRNYQGSITVYMNGYFYFHYRQTHQVFRSADGLNWSTYGTAPFNSSPWSTYFIRKSFCDPWMHPNNYPGGPDDVLVFRTYRHYTSSTRYASLSFTRDLVNVTPIYWDPGLSGNYNANGFDRCPYFWDPVNLNYYMEGATWDGSSNYMIHPVVDWDYNNYAKFYQDRIYSFVDALNPPAGLEAQDLYETFNSDVTETLLESTIPLYFMNNWGNEPYVRNKYGDNFQIIAHGNFDGSTSGIDRDTAYYSLVRLKDPRQILPPDILYTWGAETIPPEYEGNMDYRTYFNQQRQYYELLLITPDFGATTCGGVTWVESSGVELY